jgi:putative transposase
MPRLPRLDLPNIPQHLVQRGNNRQPIFFCDEDYACFIDFLRQGLIKYKCQLYAYVLMTNHVHLLVIAEKPGGLSGLMQSIGRRYVRYINTKYQRTGTLFEGRFKSSLIDSDQYLLTCMRYIDLNPVRAGMVSKPDDYNWSSYQSHVAEQSVSWLTEPLEYRALATTPSLRAAAYADLCKQALQPNELETIREHLNKDCALGTDRFQKIIEAASGRRAAIVKRGRPKKVLNNAEKSL